MAKPFNLTSNVYFDNGRCSIVEILQVDKVTVKVRYVQDEDEDNLTKDEVLHLIDSKVWTVPAKKETPKEEIKVATPKEPAKVKPISSSETITAYVHSLKRLKEGKTVQISLEPQLGWNKVDLSYQPAKMEIDLNNLNPEDVVKIMNILENKDA